MTGMTEFWYAAATWFGLALFVCFLVWLVYEPWPRGGKQPPEPGPYDPTPGPVMDEWSDEDDRLYQYAAAEHRRRFWQRRAK